MSRHILDRPRNDDGTRAERYVEIERKTAPEGSHEAVKTLHRRPKTRDGARTREFLRIDRDED